MTRKAEEEKTSYKILKGQMVNKKSKLKTGTRRTSSVSISVD